MDTPQPDESQAADQTNVEADHGTPPADQPIEATPHAETPEAEGHNDPHVSDGRPDQPSLADVPRPPRHLRFRPQALVRALRRHKLVFIASAALVLLAGGATAALVYRHTTVVQPKSKFTAVVLPFQIVSTIPANNATGVVDASKIVLKFNRAVDPAKLEGDLFSSPAVTGTFTQGANDHEAVFTPVKPYDGGTAVQIMVHGEFQSLDGSKLGADYTFAFATQTPNNNVVFMRDGYYDTVGSVKAGTSQSYTINAGNQVKTGNTITIYKSSVDQLIDSLTYTLHDNGGYTSKDFIHSGVDTAGLASVTTKSNLSDGATFSFTPDNGIYVIAATNGGKQVGYAWLVASDFGVIMRQDDQQAVFSVQDLTNGGPTSANLTLYNLAGHVNQLKQLNITGVDAAQLPYSPSLDLVVATHNGDTAVVPVTAPESLADLRVQKDLSTSTVMYGLTDRPTYATGDTVHYAGFIRTDNDANYQVPTNNTIHLFVSDSAGGTHFADLDVPIQSGGVVNGSFTINAHAIPSGETSQQLYVYDGSAANSIDASTPAGAFTLTSSKPTDYRLSVQFSKSDYVASDSIYATVSGFRPDRSPLSNQQVAVTIYAKTYYEGAPASNLASFGTYGDKVASTTITLNSSGQATVPIDVSKFPAGSSQVATVQASFNDLSQTTVAGGASAVVHEANGTLTFAPSRTVIPSGGKLIGRVYAKTLSGSPIANTAVSYTIGTTDAGNVKQFANGSVTTDANGYAEIAQQIGSYPVGTTFALTAWTADASNNKITATTYYYIQDPSGGSSFSEIQLSNLDIYGIPAKITSGQTVSLTIDSPQATHTLVTLERGRVHSYKALDLVAGKNTYSFDITDDLAPSFSLVFSYFQNGRYYTEGTSLQVLPTSKQGNMVLTMPATLQAGQSAGVNVQLRDGSGAALRAPVILGAVSANVFDLSNQVVPDIFDYLYSPREITTNASSSLTGIGSGGGRCGGGGFDQSALLNPLGATAVWQPGLATDASGSVTAKLSLPKGVWRVYAYTMGSNGEVASAYTTVTAN